MPYLTDSLRNRLAPIGAAHPDEGETVPMSDERPFVSAASWSWALAGEFEPPDNPFTPVTIYLSDEGAYLFDERRVPSGLNESFFSVTDLMFPETVPYHEVLVADFALALAGDVAAQGRCRVALAKLTAIANGHTVLPDYASQAYTLIMKAERWCEWNHWAIGIQSLDGSVTTYQQKVNDQPLKYNCGVVWESMAWPTVVIGVDGLLQPQIEMLARVGE